MQCMLSAYSLRVRVRVRIRVRVRVWVTVSVTVVLRCESAPAHAVCRLIQPGIMQPGIMQPECQPHAAHMSDIRYIAHLSQTRGTPKSELHDRYIPSC